MKKLLFSWLAVMSTVCSIAHTMNTQAGNASLMSEITEESTKSYYVKIDGTGDGSSWDKAMSGDQFRKMINAKSFANGAVVYMAAGTYYAGSEANIKDQNKLTDYMKLTTGLTIYGGFSPTMTGTSHDITYPSKYETIISGDLNKNGKADEGDCHLMKLESSSPIKIIGVTFKNGYLNEANSEANIRSGIVVSGKTTANFRYCKFVGNTTNLPYYGGAALYITQGKVSLTDCIFEDNLAYDRGGAIRIDGNWNQVLNIDRCTFTGNSTLHDWGGTIQGSSNNATVCINNSTFANNTVGSGGGAVFNGASYLFMSNCTLLDNYCPANEKIQMIRVEGNDNHHIINTIAVNDKDKDGGKPDMKAESKHLISDGYLVYGTIGNPSAFTAGSGDVAGKYKADIFGTNVLGAFGGFGQTIMPTANLKGATVDELQAFKQKYSAYIPDAIDLTIDQNGNSRSVNNVPGSALPYVVSAASSITLTAQNGNGYWATFSSDKATFFPNDVKVNTVAVDNGALKLSALSAVEATIGSNTMKGCFVPANTGVLVNAANSTISYYEVNGKTVNALSGNMLRPASEEMSGDNYFYKLAYDDAVQKTALGFYWGADDGKSFGAKIGGAYLAVPKASAQAKRVFILDDNATGINAINNNKVRANNIYYNLSGQRVDASYKGVVIVNGKKLINK